MNIPRRMPIFFPMQSDGTFGELQHLLMKSCCFSMSWPLGRGANRQTGTSRVSVDVFVVFYFLWQHRVYHPVLAIRSQRFRSLTSARLTPARDGPPRATPCQGDEPSRSRSRRAQRSRKRSAPSSGSPSAFRVEPPTGGSWCEVVIRDLLCSGCFGAKTLNVTP